MQKRSQNLCIRDNAQNMVNKKWKISTKIKNIVTPIFKVLLLTTPFSLEQYNKKLIILQYFQYFIHQ